MVERTWMSADQPQPQRRKRHLAMTGPEIDEFLNAERTCRVATMSERGPHLSALWFVWDGEFLWLYSITRSQRWADLRTDPRVAVLIDAGQEYFSLRGVELRGTAEVVGDVPRSDTPCPELDEPERRFASKYFGGEGMHHDDRHAWLRIRPEKITSWDFSKITKGHESDS